MIGPTKAELWEVDPKNPETAIGDKVKVQFNPETLRITYAGQISPPIPPSKGGDQGSSRAEAERPGHQSTGVGSTRLSVQLWFDVTSLMSTEDEGTADVRRLTDKVARFMRPKEPANADGTPTAPPTVKFLWGTITFMGVMDSLDENLELFAIDGVPLRASMNIGISQGKVDFRDRPGGGGDGSSAGLNLSAGIGIGVSASLGAGTQPLAQAEAGVSLQAMASASFGGDADWQSIASANGIENPRLLPPGQLINMNARASSSASVAGSASASFSLTGE
ncbi:MAG: hypothetical protein QOE96_736 [Blastocatellia bacterium]|nr:hypothetical protein [Blastocatellia bacterium]